MSLYYSPQSRSLSVSFSKSIQNLAESSMRALTNFSIVLTILSEGVRYWLREKILGRALKVLQMVSRILTPEKNRKVPEDR